MNSMDWLTTILLFHSKTSNGRPLLRYRCLWYWRKIRKIGKLTIAWRIFSRSWLISYPISSSRGTWHLFIHHFFSLFEFYQIIHKIIFTNSTRTVGAPDSNWRMGARIRMRCVVRRQFECRSHTYTHGHTTQCVCIWCVLCEDRHAHTFKHIHDQIYDACMQNTAF